jgi:hypothetical protein
VSLDAPDPGQSVLPVGARDDLGRPESLGETVLCGCGREVSETRKPHRVDRSYLPDRATVDVGDEKVPVFGWRCDACSRVLALNPTSTENDFGPGAGWLAIDADLAGGPGHVLVPRRVIHR